MAARTVNNFERIDINLLKDDERECGICQDEFGCRKAHYPVRLPCGHILGMPCIIKWINIIASIKRRELAGSLSDSPKGTCPFCRKQLFRVPFLRESFFELTVRMMLWGHMYSSLGIRRTKIEEESRNDLIKFCITWLEDFDPEKLSLRLDLQDYNALYDHLICRVDQFTFALRSNRLTRLQETRWIQMFGTALDWLDECSRPVMAGFNKAKPGEVWLWQVTPTIPIVQNARPCTSTTDCSVLLKSQIKREDDLS